MEDNHIKVVCRVRPANSKESHNGLRQCIQTNGQTEVLLKAKPESRTFTFDYTADSSVSQQEIFEKIGVPITETVLLGYNGTVLCYGQTGSGKTYTIFGSDLNHTENSVSATSSPCRGLVPRVLDFIWNRLSAEAAESNGEKTFSCRCSFYEIYQEKVFDLLDNSGGTSSSNCGGLSVREDSRRGVYVEGCIEEEVRSPTDAGRVLAIGYRNRHVGETAMNRESSRSHAVFQLVVDTTEMKGDVRTRRSSRFSMVDLAGSERQKDTNATGDRLKEASQINKSLSALGNVINALADVSSSGTRRHIHYRDSKLTFLLRDSLGGNSKTVLVSTVSPADVCFAETLSTLKFAQRAKSIKNAAVVNEETKGSTVALQNEILTLKMQIAEFHANGATMNLSECGSGNITSRESNSETDLKLAVRSEMEVLKEAMDRCQLADERNMRSEKEVAILSRRLAETEKSVLSNKMKLKMRDAEVRRLKSKEPVVLAEHQSVEEMIKAEVDSARQENQSEIVRYKLQCEELERRLNKFEREGMPFWQQSQEVSFNHTMLQRLLECESKVEDMFFRMDAAARCDFLNACGISVEEALEVRDNYSELKAQVDELRMANDASSLAIVNSYNTIRELENSASEYKVTSEQRITELEISVQASAAQVISLHEYLAAKTGEFDELQIEMKRMEDNLKRDQENSESARVMQYNKLMKDNMVLLKRSRELEKDREESQIKLKQYEADINSLTQEAEKTQMETQARFTQMDVKIYSLDNELATSRSEVCRLSTDLKTGNEQLEEVRRQKQACDVKLQDCHLTISTLRRDLEKSTFELENAREDADSLYTQAETLLAEVEEIKSELSVVNSDKDALVEQVAAGEVALEQTQLNLDGASRQCAQLEYTVQTMQSELNLKSNTLAAAILEKETCDAMLQASSDKIVRLESDISSLKETLSSSHATIAALEDGLMTEKGQVEGLYADLTQREEYIQTLETNITSSNETIAVLERGMRSKKTAVEELTVKLKGLEEHNFSLETAVSTANDTIAVLEEGLLSKRSELVALSAEKEGLSEQLAILVVEKKELSSNLEEVQAQYSEMTEQFLTGLDTIASLKNDMDECKSQLESVQAKKDELTSLNASALNDIARFQKDIEQLTFTASDRDAQIAELTSGNEALRSKLADAEEVKYSLTSEYATLTEQCEAMEDELQQMKKKIEEITCELAETENKLICETNEVSNISTTLEEVEADLEYHRDELNIMTQKNEFLECDLAAAKAEVLTLVSNKSTLESGMEYLSEKIDILSEQIRSMDVDNSTMLESKDNEIEKLMDTINKITAERDDIQQKFNSIRMAISAVTKNSPTNFSRDGNDDDLVIFEKGISEPMDQLRRALADKEHSNAALQQELDKVNCASKDATKKMKSLEKKITALETHVKQMESTIDEFNDEKVSLHDTNMEAQNKVSSMLEEVEGLQVRLSESVRATEIALTQKTTAENELKSARAEHTDDIAKLEAENKQLQHQTTEAAEHIMSRKRELDALRQELLKVKEQCQAFELQVLDLTKENTRLCGHQNNKQKIQQHMQLKKNIEEQMSSLKALQDQLVKVSVERDNAVEECRRLRLMSKHTSDRSGGRMATRGPTNSHNDDNGSTQYVSSTSSGQAAKKKALPETNIIVTRRRTLMESNAGSNVDAEPGTALQL